MDTPFTFFTLALGLGMLHALDADHLLTITGLSAQKNQWQHVTRYSTHWVIGHSFSLIIVGVCVFLLGITFNKNFSYFAEYFVAIILAVIGFRLLINLKSSPEPSVKSGGTRPFSSYKALIIGGIHGIAGTASILAILPLTKIHEPLIGLSYILIFSIGVLCSMLLFGKILRHTVSQLIQHSPRSVMAIQIFAGIFSFIFAMSLVYTLSK